MKKVLLFFVFVFAFFFMKAQPFINNFDGITSLTITTTGGTTLSTISTVFPSGATPGNTGNGFVVDNNTGVITTSIIDASSLTSISFSFDLASLSATSGNGADSADEVFLAVSTDGGVTYSNEIEIRGNTNARYAYTATGSVSIPYDGDNTVNTTIQTAGTTTTGTSSVTLTNLPSSNMLRIRITAMNDDGNEYWAIDNLELTATSSSVCSITNVSAVASCNGNNAEFVVNYTATNGSETYEVDINGNGFQTVANGDTYTITGPTTAVANAVITVRGQTDNTCSGTGTINIPTCPPPTTVQFTTATYSVSENGGTVQVCVSIANPSATTATEVQVTLTGGTATNGTDVNTITSPQTLTFPAGSSTDQCFTITGLNDALAEGTETLLFSISNVTGGTAASASGQTTTTVNVTDDEIGMLTILSQFVNPCGNDGSNEFILGEVTGAPIDINNLAFASAQTGTTGTEDDNFNFWWAGTNVAAPEDITGLSNETNAGSPETYGFLYPSITADATIINARINELNTAAGCNVFLAVPSTNLIPANSRVVIFLGAANCGFDNVAANLNFSNHCSGSIPSVTYYVVFGLGDGGSGSNLPCTNSSSGYFSNSNPRTSYSLVYSGSGANTQIGNYMQTAQQYTPSTVSNNSINAGIATPTGFTVNSGCVPSPSVILPVELTTFTATAINQTIALAWTTASEENNDYFQIERSLNGAKFEVLGKVKGTGTTLEPQAYSFVDAAPKAGVNYYRLKQVDYDGAFEYSNIVAAVVKYANQSLFAYPSPTSDLLVLESAVAIEQIEIRDMAGRILNRQTFGKEQTRVELNVATLTSGSYFVYVQSGAASQVVRFVKE